MADIGNVSLLSVGMGKVVVTQPNRTTVTSPNYRPKPNVAFAEINDVDTTGLQDGFTIIYSSANSKFETKSSANLQGTVTNVDGGTF
jgi:hypothetical protein